MYQLTQMQRLLGIMLIAIIFTPSCAVNPATGELDFMLVSESEERVIGRETHDKIIASFGGAYEDATLLAYLNLIGQRLVKFTDLPELGYQFTILDSPIPNAFAAPGGYIYVTRGLMALPINEAQLAGVIGHELAHINARHTAQRLTFSVAQKEICKRLHCDPNEALLKRLGIRDETRHQRRFSRRQEFEADKLAVRYLTRAGYPPAAMASLLRALVAHGSLQSKLAPKTNSNQHSNHMSTHPLTVERLAQLPKQKWDKNKSAVSLVEPAYLNAIDGLLYGNRADIGFVMGNRYSNPITKITFEAPEGFVISATSDQVTAIGPNSSTIILEKANQEFSGTTHEYLTDLWAHNFSLEKTTNTQINGMEATIGWAKRNTSRGQMEFGLVAIRYEKGKVFRILTIGLASEDNTFDKKLRNSVFSFRRLNETEVASLKQRKLRIVRVQSGDSAITLSRKMAVSSHHLEQFSVLNGLSPLAHDTTLNPGAMVKLIFR